MISRSPATKPRNLGLSHVGLKASDVEASCAFYRDFLGFAEQARLYDRISGNLMLIVLKVSETQWIEVFDGWKPGEHRLHQVAFRVSDANLMRTELDHHGARVPPKTPVGQMGNLNFEVKAPTGQIVELVQYLSDGTTERQRDQFLSTTRISDRIRHVQIATTPMEANLAFLTRLHLTKSKDDSPSSDPAKTTRTRWITDTGDFVDCVDGEPAIAHVGLDVRNITDAVNRLEHTPYRHHYPGALAWQVGADNHRFLDVFDPDGIRIRLTEGADATLT